LRRGDDPRAVTRDVEPLAGAEPLAEPELRRWPWIIDCDPAYEGWSLGAERRRWLLVAMAAISLLLVTSLSLSADARRTACRVPGVRALCAATGIGDVPTQAEQALWDAALAQDAGDGLREYLRTHPNGAYAEEARSRLAGCWIEETLGAAREDRYRLVINPKRSLPSEEEARRDAQRRGEEDAAAMCNPQVGRDVLHLVAARVEPSEWKCAEGTEPRGVKCGFEGWIVCRVRDRDQSEHCRPRGALAPRDPEAR
jgi:hypothetical protein